MIDIFHPKILVFFSILSFSYLSHAKNYDVVILGDSISSGYGVDAKENWVPLAQRALECKVKLKNISVQGATSHDGITTLENFYQTNNSRYLVLELGGNDALRGLSLIALYKNLNQLVMTALENKSQVILIGIDLPPNYGDFFRQRLQSTYQRIADQYSIPYIQLTFPNNAALVQQDGIHPSTAGHTHIADALTPLLSEKLCH